MKDIFSFFEKPKDPVHFNAIRVSIASPEKIREWSHGEVKKPHFRMWFKLEQTDWWLWVDVMAGWWMLCLATTE